MGPPWGVVEHVGYRPAASVTTGLKLSGFCSRPGHVAETLDARGGGVFRRSSVGGHEKMPVGGHETAHPLFPTHPVCPAAPSGWGPSW